MLYIVPVHTQVDHQVAICNYYEDLFVYLLGADAASSGTCWDNCSCPGGQPSWRDGEIYKVLCVCVCVCVCTVPHGLFNCMLNYDITCCVSNPSPSSIRTKQGQPTSSEMNPNSAATQVMYTLTALHDFFIAFLDCIYLRSQQLNQDLLQTVCWCEHMQLALVYCVVRNFWHEKCLIWCLDCWNLN